MLKINPSHLLSVGLFAEHFHPMEGLCNVDRSHSRVLAHLLDAQRPIRFFRMQILQTDRLPVGVIADSAQIRQRLLRSARLAFSLREQVT